MSNAHIQVKPTFALTVDSVSALAKIEMALAFYRNAHPAQRDPELDSLLLLFKATQQKVREYDAALRGINVSASAGAIQPTAEPAPKKIDTPTEPAKPAAPASPTAGGAPPGFSPPGAPQTPPGGFPPPVKKAAPPSPAGAEVKAREELGSEAFDALMNATKIPESGATPPPSQAPQLTTDEAIRGTAPPESKSPALGAPPPPWEGPPGASPPAVAPPTSKPTPATPTPGLPPGTIPGLPGGAPGAPATPGNPPPPASEGAPPPPDEEF